LRKWKFGYSGFGGAFGGGDSVPLEHFDDPGSAYAVAGVRINQPAACGAHMLVYGLVLRPPPEEFRAAIERLIDQRYLRVV
jgi:hypothetical protein